MQRPQVAAVVLNYNSEADLEVCLPQLARQEGVRLSIIVVDNASSPSNLAAARSWVLQWRPDAVRCTAEDACALQSGRRPDLPEPPVFFVENKENCGYSAGNNTGIRLAEALGADAVLLANPDMRLENPHYIRDLAASLLADREAAVAASRIVGLDGLDQNPQVESTFAQELLWPVAFLGRRRLAQPASSGGVVSVHKVSGCCLMLRVDFLVATGRLDERVFLYCEEAILAAKVREARKRILYVPGLVATHAHLASAKGSASRRMAFFIASRKYYLKRYSGYGRWSLRMLLASYWFRSQYWRLRAALRS